MVPHSAVHLRGDGPHAIRYAVMSRFSSLALLPVTNICLLDDIFATKKAPGVENPMVASYFIIEKTDKPVVRSPVYTSEETGVVIKGTTDSCQDALRHSLLLIYFDITANEDCSRNASSHGRDRYGRSARRRINVLYPSK